MIKVSVKTKTNKKVVDVLQSSLNGYVKVGWFEGQREPNGILVAENAYRQEHGFMIKHKNGKTTYVKPRPFLHITMNKSKENWAFFWKQTYKSILERKRTLKQALNELGTIVKTAIQWTIISSNGIRPNKPSTIQAKKYKGSPLIPLIDSGTMLNTINYHSEVNKR